MKKDTSRDIYEQYYGNKERYVCVTLKDGTVMIGRFIGMFHGDEESGEPFILRWHFLEKGKESPLKSTIFPTQEEGIYIDHKNIESVIFS